MIYVCKDIVQSSASHSPGSAGNRTTIRISRLFHLNKQNIVVVIVVEIGLHRLQISIPYMTPLSVIMSTLNAPLSSLFSPHSSLFSDKEDQPALVSLGGPSHQLSIIPTKTAPSNISPLSPGARLGWLLTFYISSHLASKWMAGSLVQRDWSVTL